MVHITYIFESHDSVPLEILRKDLESLGLLYKWGEFIRIMPVRHTQKQSLPVHCQTPDLKITGA